MRMGLSGAREHKGDVRRGALPESAVRSKPPEHAVRRVEGHPLP
jgi:hypothetical protein